MKNGDLVIGTPLATDGPEELPSEVVGRLELVPVDFGSKKWTTALVYVVDSEMDDLPVEVEEDSLRPATRRQKVTVLRSE